MVQTQKQKNVVYVVTEAEVFGIERYMFVKRSRKEAIKALRKLSPHMRPTDSSIKDTECYFTDGNKTMLYFVHREEI